PVFIGQQPLRLFKMRLPCLLFYLKYVFRVLFAVHHHECVRPSGFLVESVIDTCGCADMWKIKSPA
ncbi:hypothetical protein, partial [uncultured Muribaculum sp.]|uniref:hypothetical protein n=1 Tax=uncultured Muribaculum sp. TaxID=1918613 RepID=UPI0025E17753